jgi:hypothetical protein
MQNKRNMLLLIGGSLMVLVVFFFIGLTIFTSNDPVPPNPAPVVEKETSLTLEEELAFQEQISPLIAAGDMTACDQVQNDRYQKVCINNIALSKAEETNDISYCQHIDNELIPRADCERQVVDTLSQEREDITVCNQATDTEVQTQCKESYHLALALKKNDQTICMQATNPSNCSDTFYLRQFMQDPAKVSCDLFFTPEAQADCAALKAVATDQQALMQFCQEKQSPLFALFCQSKGMQLLNLDNPQTAN